jgi:ribosomal protein L24
LFKVENTGEIRKGDDMRVIKGRKKGDSGWRYE